MMHFSMISSHGFRAVRRI